MEMIVLQGVSEAKIRSRCCWLLFCPTKSPYLYTLLSSDVSQFMGWLRG